jgi:hypothetical protein
LGDGDVSRTWINLRILCALAWKCGEKWRRFSSVNLFLSSQPGAVLIPARFHHLKRMLSVATTLRRIVYAWFSFLGMHRYACQSSMHKILLVRRNHRIAARNLNLRLM